MSEKELKKLLGGYLNDTCSDQEKVFLDTFFDSYGIESDLGGLSDFDYDLLKKEMMGNIKKKVRGIEGRQKKSGYSLWRPWYGIVASFLVLLGISVGFLLQTPEKIEVKQPLLLTQTSLSGQKTDIVLSDGTKIRLNSGSTLVFPDSFGNMASREVTLIGEAFFDVTPNPSKPFIINSGELVTKVLGTSFNISAYPENNLSMVTVATGEVEVTPKFDAADGVIITPNEQAVFNKDNENMQTRKVAMDRYLNWKNGIIQFEDETLGRVAEVLERWYGVHIAMENKALAECHITATYDNARLSVILKSIVYAKKNMEYTYLSEKEVLLKGSCGD
ncbi:FecR family protein [Maribacter sp. 2304DJ31-5]|uniref:FecR family protein n=1 Tax=Maribacter sp. 2304DJ31-5 TaxID=3386273 RepID=UPI0039BD6F07